MQAIKQCVEKQQALHPEKYKPNIILLKGGVCMNIQDILKVKTEAPEEKQSRRDRLRSEMGFATGKNRSVYGKARRKKNRAQREARKVNRK